MVVMKTPPQFVSFRTFSDPTDELSAVRHGNNGYVVKIHCLNAKIGDIVEVSKMGGKSRFVRLTGVLAAIGGFWLCSFEFVDEEGNPLPLPDFVFKSIPSQDSLLEDDYDFYFSSGERKRDVGQ